MSLSRLSKHPPKTSVIFLGTGVSTALPSLSCIVNTPPPAAWPSVSLPDLSSENMPKKYPCPVCSHARDHALSPNRRGNVSIVLRYGDHTIMVDCGKTMREAVIQWFPPYGLKHVDAVLLTHDHADAMGGMDDLRDLQERDADGHVKGEIDIFLSRQTYERSESVYAYLMPKKEPKEENAVWRRVARLKWNIIEPNETISVYGLQVTPFNVLHGADYLCFAFLFGRRKNFVYISDVSEVPSNVMLILESIPVIDLLVVDALMLKKHNTHFNLDQAVGLAMHLKPKQTLLVGMTCSMGLHDETNERLKEYETCPQNGMGPLDIQLARDGMMVELDLE